MYQSHQPTVGVVLSRLRQEEKLLLAALEDRGCPVQRIDDRDLIMRLEQGEEPRGADIFLLRSISQFRTLYTAALLNDMGLVTVNSHTVLSLCNDKVLTASRLRGQGVPIPRTRVAFTPDSALAAVEELGYPVVLKPPTGSWGRLVARLNDRHAAEAVLEDRSVLGSAQHSVFYLQEYIDKPDRDIRAVFLGDRCVAAMYRYSQHWITNAARGGQGVPCPLSAELVDLVEATARAAGGGVLAVDLLEAPGGLLVNEINPTLEFKALSEASGVDMAGLLVDYLLEVARAA